MDAVPGLQFSGFPIDLPTLYLVTFFVAVTAGLLLLFSWLQNRSIPALACWGSGYLLGATAAAFVAARGLMPAGWGIFAAYLVASSAYGVFWAGARSFEGRRRSCSSVR